MKKEKSDRPESDKTAVKKRSSSKLEEGLDYYINEQGLFVLTEHYLLNRGYCCGNGCTHCPYDESK